MLQTRMRPALAVTAFLAVALSLFSATATGQGLTGASVEGIVITATGVAVPNAAVTITDMAMGANRRADSRSAGAFVFENVDVGVYRIEARAIGLRPAVVDSIEVHIGDRIRLRLTLGAPASQSLETVRVNGSLLTDPGSGGAANAIPRAAIRNLPLLNRDFVGLFGMSSQAAGPASLSLNGQNVRFNAIQIDGATTNDLFGANITAGSNAGAHAISLEALDEIRVLIAPFDIRQSGFSGGMINAVTRSGTNQFRGAAFTSYSRGNLVGDDSASAFNQLQYGVSLGGPIVRDKLHYFAVVEAQSLGTQFAVAPADAIATFGVTRATADRATDAIRNQFNFDPGTGANTTLQQPNNNMFVKLSWTPSEHHSVDLTTSYSNASKATLGRAFNDIWQLSNSGMTTRSTTYNARVRTVSNFGAITNELLTGLSSTQDRLDSRNRVPNFVITADRTGTLISAGSVRGSQGTRTDQQSFEFTDNLSWQRGTHSLTLGTQNLFAHVHDIFFKDAWGVWSFDNVDSLERAAPSAYTVAIPRPGGRPATEASFAEIAAYLQDVWRATDRLTITGGVRVDVPRFNAPTTNSLLLNDPRLRSINTGIFPTGNAVLAPRFAFTWDLGTHRTSMLRAGVGAFTGRPPLAWLTNAFSNTGQEQATLSCTQAKGGVPAVVTEISKLPTTCTTNTILPVPSVTYFDARYRFQQSIKYVLGLDHDFGRGWLGSIDAEYTYGRNGTTVTDVNLAAPYVNAEGRAMYGDVPASGVARPTRLDNQSFGPIYRYTNLSGERYRSLSLNAQRHWSERALVQVGYTWSQATDANSLSGLTGAVSLAGNPVDGSLENRRQRRSARDIPHSMVVTAVGPLPLNSTGSLFFRSRSGTPFAFTISGDANADSVPRNDLVYVPKNADDISLASASQYAALDSAIESQPCLRAQRGHIVTRNSCRNPAVFTLDGRVAKRFGKFGHGVEVGVDLFNLPNLLNRDWALARQSTTGEALPLLAVAGWDATRNRPVYSTVLRGASTFPFINSIVDASRWRIQLSARYDY